MRAQAPTHPTGDHDALLHHQHQFYCGVDLHARTISLYILDADGRIIARQDHAAAPAAFLDTIAPCRDGQVVGCECMFAWYWLADLCAPRRSPSCSATPST